MYGGQWFCQCCPLNSEITQMARFWAHILKEYNAAGTASEFRGANVKGDTDYGYAAGTVGTDYIIPDIEDQSLSINDTNNFYPIVSYASKGGMRHGVVVGYSVAGSFATKLYREHADFLIGSALTKEDASTNPLGDIPSLQIDRCFWDSDPVAPKLYADSYKGVKIGTFSLTVGAQSPIVQAQMQLLGSTCTPITVTNGVPAKGKKPACTEYPVNPYTFKQTSVYADFNGTGLYTITSGTKNWTVPTAKKLITIRSVSLTFLNNLASTSHSDGVLDRIQRTVQAAQYSIVVDLSDPDGTGTGDGTYGSQIFRKRYRDMRDAVEGGRVAFAVVFDDGVKRISFDLGPKTVFDGLQHITPIPDIFAAQISGMAMFNPADCNTFDWNIENLGA